MNSTHIAASSSTSVSTCGAANSPYAINHHLGPDQAGSLGHGLGRLARGVFDQIANWWYRPSPEQVEKQRVMQIQIQVFPGRIKALAERLDSDLLKIGNSPNDVKALKRIQAIASEYEGFLETDISEDWKNLLIKEFEKRKTTISILQSKQPAATDKLKPILPMLFQNDPIAEKETNLVENRQIMKGRIKKHTRARKKKTAQQQQIRNAEGPNKSSVKAAEEKNDEKRSLYPNRGAKSKKSESHSNYERGQVPTCPVSYDLGTPNPKFFMLTAPISPGNTNGFNIAGIDDVNNDGIQDFAIADPGATPPGDGPAGAGQVWIVYGGPNVSSVDLTNLTSSQGFMIYGVQKGGLGNSDGLGYAMVGLGDFNADGHNDVGLVGAQLSVYVLFGPLLNSIDLTTCNGQKCFIVNGISSDLAPCLAGGKDISGDGIPDLLVGAPSTASGYLFGIFGGPGPWPAQFNVIQLTGPNGFAGGGTNTKFSQLGCPIVMGNLQKSSIASFVVAAPGANNGAGILYVFNGRNGTWPGMLNFTLDGTSEGFTGSGSGGNLAQALIIGGDFNNDGNTDIIATNANNEFYDIGTNGVNVWQTSNTLSTSIASIDINNDGNLDIATGINGADDVGGLLLVLGQSNGSPPPSDLDTANSYYVDIVSGVFGSFAFGGNSNLPGGGILGGGNLANLGNIIGNGSEVLGATALNAGNGIVYFLLSYTPTCPPPPSTTSPTGSTTGSKTSSTTSSTGSTTSPSSPPSNNPGAIIGGVVGGVILVAAGVTLVFLKVMKKGPFAEGNKVPERHNKANAFFKDLK